MKDLESINTTRYSQNIDHCAHCNGAGTCTSGKDGNSCAACVKANELKKGEYLGLACGTCGGLGKTDTLTHRLNNRVTPILAVAIVCFSFSLITFFGILKSEYFNEILAFCGPLSGSAIAFYFGNNSSK